MSYTDRKREGYSSLWLALGWLNIALIPLLTLALLASMIFMVAFCDAPGSCRHAGTYFLIALIAPIMLWLWLFVSLIRKRHLIAPLVVAIAVDLAAGAGIVGLSFMFHSAAAGA